MVNPADVKTQLHEPERSTEWPEFRKKFIAKHPNCAVCGKGGDKVGLQAHHIFPFHYCIKLGRPKLELDERNLITLCEDEAGKPSDNHHLIVGHLDDFESSNLDVEADALRWKNQSEASIKNDPAWQAKHNNKLPHLPAMTDADKAAFTWAMNHRYPDDGVSAGPKPANLPSWIPNGLTPKPKLPPL